MLAAGEIAGGASDFRKNPQGPARREGRSGAGGFSARVVLAQLRSTAVDRLQAAGMTRDDALNELPVLSRRAAGARGTSSLQCSRQHDLFPTAFLDRGAEALVVS
jgi:hypothetical protein